MVLWLNLNPLIPQYIPHPEDIKFQAIHQMAHFRQKELKTLTTISIGGSNKQIFLNLMLA